MSNLYLDNHSRYVEITNKMELLNKELSIKEDRWLEILEMQENMKKSN